MMRRITSSASLTLCAYSNTRAVSHTHGNEQAYSSIADFVKSNPSASEIQQQNLTSSPMQDVGANADPHTMRLVRENIEERDSLGGMWHRDYYRDPTEGFTLNHAPRNFSQGGRMRHFYPQSPLAYEEGSHQRSFSDHEHQLHRRANATTRDMMRNLSPQDRVRFLEEEAKSQLGSVRAGLQHNQSLLPQDIMGNHMTENLTQTQVSQRGNYTNQSAKAANVVSGRRLVDRLNDQEMEQSRRYEEESMRRIHGLRDKERFEAERSASMQRSQLKGFDLDKMAAQRQGTLYGQLSQFQSVVPAGGMQEEQKALRENAIPADVDVTAKVLSKNSTSSEPRVGESLTEHIVEAVEASKNSARRAREAQHREKMGYGRQGALVTESGPDKRVQKMMKNDERLLKAALFDVNAYKESATENHRNPYERNSTEEGVGHLLRTKFDIDRRTARLSEGAQDITERSTVFYGTPVAQQVDNFVQRKRGARAERHLDFFLPGARWSDMRLNHPYRDLEGFPLLNTRRPAPFEWELFVRYRAHHQQRRELAFKYGLEPVVNETREERDIRRAKLDRLCENTPFDESRLRLKGDEEDVSVETLRQWFGEYVLPSPTVADKVVSLEHQMGLHLAGLEREKTGEVDTREHLLSGRYINKLLCVDQFNSRTNRHYLGDVQGRIPDPKIAHRLSPEVLKHFSKSELDMYNRYIKQESDKHIAEHTAQANSARWLEEYGQHGTLQETLRRMEVIDLQSCTDMESVITVGCEQFAKDLAAVASKPNPSLVVDGVEYKVKFDTRREVAPVVVRLEGGQTVHMEDADFTTRPLQNASEDPNAMLNYGQPKYHYNRANYIETQDTIWEEQTYAKAEGWSQALHCDGLRAGLPVRARRTVGTTPQKQTIRGDYARAEIINYNHQPFYNPNPRTVTVRFMDDLSVEDVPLDDMMIWQLSWGGPERTIPDESRRTVPTIRRYVDVSDPLNEKKAKEPHFLDRYAAKSTTSKFRSVKQITDLDNWNTYDLRRSANHRLLSSSHRKDYVRGGYFNRYTPWEWINLQEMDQPLIKEQMRSDDVGPASFHAPNRFWRYKRRGYGSVKNFKDEVKDMMQYVDGTTSWSKAQKVRTLAEVREHHPVPVFNKPQVALHRNTASLLPSHMWETDKRSGSVKFLKDSVKDYKTTTPVPAWVKL